MIKKIKTVEDLKDELFRYFETMRALPAPKIPGYAKNYLWELAKIDVTTEDDAASPQFVITGEYVADCWFIADHWMPQLTKFEYMLLSERLRERPIPWKVLEEKHRSSRQLLNIYIRKALQRLFEIVKE